MRRIGKFFLGGMLGLGAIFVVMVVISIVGASRIGEKSTLYIKLDGELADAPASGLERVFGEGQTTLPLLTTAIRRAAKDDRIHCILLRVAEPQLRLAQIQEIEAAMAVAREAGKSTRAFLETAGEFSAGDGALAAAVTADHVVLSPPGDINLFGVQLVQPFIKGTLERLHIGAHVEMRHEYKTAANLFTEESFTPAQRESYRAFANDLQAQLEAHLAARRKTEQKTVRAWFKAGILDAATAKDRGLVDEVAYWDALRSRAEAEAGRDEKVMVSLNSYLSDLDAPSGPEFGLVILEGKIVRGPSSDSATGGSGSAGSDTIAKAFRDARKAKVKGVLFRVNSPGGSYLASDIIRREVELTREAGIPVVVSMGALAASGGYFVSMQADRIVAEPATLTGSIGVFAGLLSLRNFMKDFLGVTWDTYRAAPGPRPLDWLDPPSEATRERLSASLDRIYGDFVDKAAKGRATTYEAMHALAKGRVWTGKAAQERGLVDELGGIHVAAERIKEAAGLDGSAEVSFSLFPRPKSLLESIKATLQGNGGSAQLRRALPNDARKLLGYALTPLGDRVLLQPADARL